MIEQNKPPMAEGPATGIAKEEFTKLNSITIGNQLGKLDYMLLRFAHGDRLHRFQAERIGDHCVHTTVSDIQIKHGIKFSRRRVKVPNRFGKKTSVCEYWLEGNDLLRARVIAGLEVGA